MIKTFMQKHKDLILLGTSQLIFGMMGALMVQLFFSLNVPTIATVNISGLENSFIKETTNKALSPDEMKLKVTQFAHALNQSVVDIAKEKHVVLMMSEAVVAGHRDLTPEVANRIKKGLSS